MSDDHKEEREYAERQQAIEAAAEALGISKEYSIRIHYAKRDVDEYQHVCSSLDEACNYAWDCLPIDDCEGDEIGYVQARDSEDDEWEIDMRRNGEPFSWQAVDFVKALAKVETCSASAMHEWVHKAIDLLKK